ncbi:MAG TPA: hypothetical protein VGS41_13395, partial [Chthonomonadales bacterium]|nr:hypothetical protein [Chthonomonadales bacterium]
MHAKVMVRAKLESVGESAEIEVEGQQVAVSRLDAYLWPSAGTQPAFTKRDLLLYFTAMSDHLLRHLRDRPLTLARYPGGITGPHFVQRRLASPPFVKTVPVYSETGKEDHEFVLCENLATLLWLGQIADLELHSWTSRWSDAQDGAALSMRTSGSLQAVESSVLNYPD